MKEEDKILLQQIANHLIVNSSFLDDLGLYHGKMGLVLFFALLFPKGVFFLFTLDKLTFSIII